MKLILTPSLIRAAATDAANANMTLEQRATQLFPRSVEMQQRWIAAKQHAAKLPPKWSRMVPLSADQIPRADDQFCCRTLPR